MIDLMTVCRWVETRCERSDTRDPSWDSVEAAIRALNNEDRNDVYLYPRKSDSETYLCVGGGAGRYVVTGSVGNQTFPTVVEPSVAPGRYEVIVVGGQASRFPAEHILTLDVALPAVRAFYDSCRFEGGGTWVTW